LLQGGADDLHMVWLMPMLPNHLLLFIIIFCFLNLYEYLYFALHGSTIKQ